MEKLNTEKLNTKGIVGTEEKTGELLKAITGLVDLQLMPVQIGTHEATITCQLKHSVIR